MAQNQQLVWENVALDSIVGAIEIPVGPYQKATVQFSNPTLALGSLAVSVTRSVARGFSNAEAYSSPVSITTMAISGPHDVQGYAYLYIAVTTAGTSGLLADLTVHLESTVN